jgi:syntaxin 1B/2/3
MSNGYQQYGGNPYEGAGQAESGYGQSNPYGGHSGQVAQGGYGTSNPYGSGTVSSSDSSTSRLR